jgi:hypothetical protein
MKLPFLKNSKWPRVAPPMDEKAYGFDPDEEITEHCIQELMRAATDRDVPAFRAAIQALVLQMFDDAEEAHAG